MTYARSRLWLGISGVGFFTVLAAAALVGAWPVRWLPDQPASLLDEALALGALFVLYLVVSWPLDYLGGHHLPCRFSRLCQILPAYLMSLARAGFVQGAVVVVVGLSLLAAGRSAGRAGALGVLAAWMIALVAGQARLAKWVGGMNTAPQDLGPVLAELQRLGLAMPRVEVVAGIDPGFTGGWVGLPGAERLILPAMWVRLLPADLVAAQIARRIGVLRSGARTRGLLAALAWNLTGFGMASYLPGAGFETVAQLVSTSLGFTLWSFAGLLLLPSVTRPAVIAADRFARERGVSEETLSHLMVELDQMQDDEPARHPWIERIFHPVPSVTSRRAGREGAGGAWQAARLALYLSWPCFGLLARAVHCNSGRPELWVLFPSD